MGARDEDYELEEGNMKVLKCSMCREILKVTFEDEKEILIKPCAKCDAKAWHSGIAYGKADPHGFHEMGR